MTVVVGQPITLTGLFTDGAGNPVDPTTVTCTVTQPDGTTASPAASSSFGTATANFTPSQAGQYQFYFTGTGTNPGVTDPDVFTAEPHTTGNLISLAEAKRQLAKTGTADDEAILGYIASATEIVNSLEGVSVPTQYTETVTTSIDGTGRRVLIVSKTPVLSVQSITPRQVGMPTVDISTLNINPESGVLYLGNWFIWFGPQQVAYTAGRIDVPQVLKDACALLVKWLWETRRASSVTTPNQGGSEVITYKGVPMPERVAALLAMNTATAAPGLA